MATYTKAQREALYLLAEECAEVTQAAMKCLRHGASSVNPLLDDGPTNRVSLEKELGHVQLALNLAIEQGVVTRKNVEEARRRKWSKISRWLHHFKPKGAL